MLAWLNGGIVGMGYGGVKVDIFFFKSPFLQLCYSILYVQWCMYNVLTSGRIHKYKKNGNGIVMDRVFNEDLF